MRFCYYGKTIFNKKYFNQIGLAACILLANNWRTGQRFVAVCAIFVAAFGFTSRYSPQHQNVGFGQKKELPAPLLDPNAVRDGKWLKSKTQKAPAGGRACLHASLWLYKIYPVLVPHRFCTKRSIGWTKQQQFGSFMCERIFHPYLFPEQQVWERPLLTEVLQCLLTERVSDSRPVGQIRPVRRFHAVLDTLGMKSSQ